MAKAVKVEAKDNVWIEYQGSTAQKLAEVCAATVAATGAYPHMVDSGSDFINANISGLSDTEIEDYGLRMLEKMRTMQGYIRIKDDADQSKITLPPDKKKTYKTAMKPMVDYRVNNVRWLLVAAPTKEFAAACSMALAQFEEFYLNVCLVDYSKMTDAVEPLKKIMAEGKKVRIVSVNQETDLSFSIEGIGAKPCTGVRNIPDGECFTAPVKDSINGIIKFGPSCYEGQRFSFIKLAFKNGRIEVAEAESPERTAKLNEILNTDAGARFIGEFAINFNPYVLHPTGSILFDEKINGGIHMAAGSCYVEADNGNLSTVHWDMVHIQRPDYGGGEIWIDERLIRKDGLFVVPELLALNPENLMAAAGSSASAPERDSVQTGLHGGGLKMGVFKPG